MSDCKKFGYTQPEDAKTTFSTLARLQRFGKHQAVEKKIGRRAGLMQIHVAAAAVIGGEMKDRVHTVHGGARDARLAQVGVDKINLASAQFSSNVVQSARWSRSSTMRTYAPRSRSLSVSVEPMNEAPPVTRTRFAAPKSLRGS